MPRHIIAPVDELPPGTRKFVELDGRRIAIFNIKGEFFGLLNRCPHQGAALCEGPLIGLAQSKNPGEIEPWQSLLKRNTPGKLPPTLPVFLAQGTADKLVRPQVTWSYKAQLCDAGSRVRMLALPGVSHGFAGAKSADAAVAWIADRFAGKPAPSDCGG